MIQIFTVYDEKAEAYLLPFFLPSVVLAQRSFSGACSDSSHDFWKYAEDYTLFHLGEYDELTGDIRPFQIHKSLGNALEYRIIEEPQPLVEVEDDNRHAKEGNTK